MTTTTATRTSARVPGAHALTVADLAAVARAVLANLRERADLTDPREWTDPRRAQYYAAALRDGRAWSGRAAVFCRVSYWRHAAAEALDAAINEVIPASVRPACYLAEHDGTWGAYFGEAAAREWGEYRRTLPGAHAGDAGPAELAAALGETSTDPGRLAKLAQAYHAGRAGWAWAPTP